MENNFGTLKDLYLTVDELSEIQLKAAADDIYDIIKDKITNERIISKVFDNILSINYVDADMKRFVFYQLSNYCRKFNSKLANDYDEILEESLSYNIDED